MGYLSHIHGSMSLSRELNHAEVKAVEAATDPNGWFGLDVWEDEEDTDTGRITAKSADAIIVTYDEGGKAYSALEELQKLINALPGDVGLTGSFRRTGEESPDVSRYVLKPTDPRTVIEEKPRLVWPDGSEEPVRR